MITLCNTDINNNTQTIDENKEDIKMAMLSLVDALSPSTKPVEHCFLHKKSNLKEVLKNDVQKKRKSSRSLSETSLTRSSDSNKLILNRNLLEDSPTIKLLLKNVKKTSSSSRIMSDSSGASFLSTSKITDEKEPRRRSLRNKKTLATTITEKHKIKISFNELLKSFSLSMLAFKRSFSYTNLKLEQKYIKKSSSFEKFLQNVVKGKQKSLSLCNFNFGHSENNIERAKNMEKDLVKLNQILVDKLSDADLSVSLHTDTSNSSSETESLNQMMMMIMNNNSNTNWPLLKIEDSSRGSTQELEPGKKLKLSQNDLIDRLNNLSDLKDGKTLLEKEDAYELIKHDDSYIPNNVRIALESAGIDIDQIITMTNELEMSFQEIDSKLSKNEKSNQPKNQPESNSFTINTNLDELVII